MKPRLRIISVLYNNQDCLDLLLDSIQAEVEIPSEIVLYDNQDHSSCIKNYLDTNPDFPFKIHRFGDKKNHGFAYGANAASQFDTGEIPEAFFFLNPDGYLASSLTEATYEQMLSLEGLCGIRVFDDPARMKRQANARSFPSMWTSLVGREGIITRYFPNNPWSRKYLGADLSSNQPTQVDWLSGSALFSPRSIWEKLHGFDASYFLYAEDVDLGRRAKSLGVPRYYLPKIDFIHQIRGSSEGSHWLADYYHHRGMWRYYMKWSSSIEKVLMPVIFLGIWARFVLRRFIRI